MSRGPKKSAVTRRTPQASRGPARAGVPAAKMTGARKGAGRFHLPAMPALLATRQVADQVADLFIAQAID